MPNNKAVRDLQVIDPVLTQIARRYEPEGLVYDQLAPAISVDTLSGQYPVWPIGEWYGDEVDNQVSDRATTPEVDFSWSTETYLCSDYRLKASITAQERRQAVQALRLEQSKLSFVLQRMAMRRERRLAALLLPTANGGALTGGGTTPSQLWDTSSATIEADIKTGKLAVYNKTGRVPNTIVIPYNVAAAVAIQEDIRDILKYTVNGSQIIDRGEFILPANLWGMRVLVPRGALVNTAREGAAASLSEVWGKHVRLLYVDAQAGWGVPSVAYSFRAMSQQVDRWSEKDPPVDYIRAWESVDEKVCAPDMGYVLTSTIS